MTPFFSLGEMPLANALLREEQLGTPDVRVELGLALCSTCSLVQLTDQVAPEVLFSDYVYFSSYSDTVLENARQLCERVIGERGLSGEHLVVELASNDGYLLKNYVAAGVPVLGVEPAKNIAQLAEERGIRTVNTFFNLAEAQKLSEQGFAADVMHANNVLAHVPDPVDFVRGIAHLLKPDGAAYIEVPYVESMLEGVEFDTIYHEHLCYFSVTALQNIVSSAGLALADVELIPIHGGSLRLTLKHGNQAGASTQALLDKEAAAKIHSLEHYRSFRESVEGLRRELLELLEGLRRDGKTVVGYGASAKGAILLNYFGIDKRLLDCLVDRSPFKQGLYAPGNHLKIESPEYLTDKQPDYALLLAWNFADEILRLQHAYCEAGGKFIIPIPRVHIR